MRQLLSALVLTSLAILACKPPKPVPQPPIVQPVDSMAVQRQLVATYQNGQVTRCFIDSAVVYFGARNAPDAGAEIFDSAGKKIGTCYFSTNQVDPICHRAFDCTDIYRVSPNIWGQPGIEFKGK